MTMRKVRFILPIILLALSSASRPATDNDAGSMGVGWTWILAFFLYALMALLFALALCRAAALADAREEESYEAALQRVKQATAATGAAVVVDGRIERHMLETTAQADEQCLSDFGRASTNKEMA